MNHASVSWLRIDRTRRCRRHYRCSPQLPLRSYFSSANFMGCRGNLVRLCPIPLSRLRTPTAWQWQRESGMCEWVKWRDQGSADRFVALVLSCAPCGSRSGRVASSRGARRSSRQKEKREERRESLREFERESPVACSLLCSCHGINHELLKRCRREEWGKETFLLPKYGYRVNRRINVERMEELE